MGRSTALSNKRSYRIVQQYGIQPGKIQLALGPQT
jgi:hypothetical protein